MKALGQSPDPGAYCSPCSVCFGCEQHFPLFQLDWCFAPPRRHLRSQPCSPDSWAYAPNAFEETPFILICEREKRACINERRRFDPWKWHFDYLHPGTRGQHDQYSAHR